MPIIAPDDLKAGEWISVMTVRGDQYGDTPPPVKGWGDDPTELLAFFKKSAKRETWDDRTRENHTRLKGVPCQIVAVDLPYIAVFAVMEGKRIRAILDIRLADFCRVSPEYAEFFGGTSDVPDF